MKPFLLFVTLLAIGLDEGFGQLNEWTWMSGDSAVNKPSVYDISNVSPGKRYGSVTWKTSDGSIWLFGGVSTSTYPYYLNFGIYNDLWRYDPNLDIWEHIKGSGFSDQLGFYGIQGVPSDSNSPGSRRDAVGWIDSADNLWLFGGYGPSARLNDLWKFNTETGNWTWISGAKRGDVYGVYGTQGSATNSNYPGSREKMIAWRDSNDIFWLFGGHGYGASTLGYLNDLWKYNPATSQWTWVKGSSAANQLGTYGTQGVGNTNNTPGARRLPSSWCDEDGNLWLYGGYGYHSSAIGKLSDMWKYSPSLNQWIWFKGSSSGGVSPSYGTKGVSSATNQPGGAEAFTTWYTSNNLWLFGGDYGGSNPAGNRNSLWRFSFSNNQWTWMAGENYGPVDPVYENIGQFDSLTHPGSDYYHGNAWIDSNELWMFGGNSSAIFVYGLNENKWKWVNGSRGGSPYFQTDTTEIANPGARAGSSVWKGNGGTVWLYGGTGKTPNLYTTYYADLWKFNENSNEWTFVSGDPNHSRPGDHGQLGIPSPNSFPGSRKDAASCMDQNGNLWLFGGEGFTYTGKGKFNDLWKFDTTTNEWTWIRGSSSINQPGIYGAQGTPDSNSNPGARDKCYLWCDSNNIIWLFGGHGYDTSDLGYLSDLWKYDPSTNIWTWIHGYNDRNNNGVYGTQGTSDSSNIPGGRMGYCGWIDSLNQIWIFGGYGYASSSIGRLADMWKYSPALNEWVWMCGVSSANAPGQNASSFAPGNYPASIFQGGCWMDNLGNFWLYGGAESTTYSTSLSSRVYQYSVSLNQWRFVTSGVLARFYSLQVEATSSETSNTPGTKARFVTWLGHDNKLWLFGGNRYTSEFQAEPGNDVWRFNTSNNRWTWMGGSQNPLAQPSSQEYNEIASTSLSPGGFAGTATFSSQGNAIISGGGRYYLGAEEASLDVWEYSTNDTAWIDKTPPYVRGSQTGIYNGGPSSYSWPPPRKYAAYAQDESNHFWIFGGLRDNVTDPIEDLWMFDASNQRWSRLHGNNSSYIPPVWGEQGVPSSQTKPGSRYGHSMWIDTAGNVWVFGNSSYNDLWKFDTASKLWTWVKGDSVPSVEGHYGTLGVPSSTNCPGARIHAQTWTDSNNDFWLLGGATANGGKRNDLWKYDVSENTWIWINGDSTVNQSGVYGTMGLSDSTNKPGARSGGMTWVDFEDNFWLYGGQISTGSSTVIYSDLWKYEIQSNSWTWVNGSNSFNDLCAYGQRGIASPQNKPGSRVAAASWVDNNGNLWLAGGHGNTSSSTIDPGRPSLLNDVWKYTLHICDVTAQVSEVGHNICFGDTSGFISIAYQGNTGIINYSWQGTEASLTSPSNLSAGNYTITISDAYNCTATVSATINQPTAISIDYDSVINENCFGDSIGEIVISCSGGTGNLNYSWNNGSSDTINQFLESGEYSVTITDDSACTLVSSYAVTEPEPILANYLIDSISCYQISDASIKILTSGGTGNYTYNWSNGSNLDSLTNIESGTYYLTVSDSNNCIFYDSIEITSPDSITLQTFGINDPCFESGNGMAVASGFGGTGNLIYQLSTNQFNDTLFGLFHGFYEITATDINGCQKSDSIFIGQPESPLEISLDSVYQLNCFGDTLPFISAGSSGGSGNHSYYWSNANSSNDTLFNLIAGTYVLIVDDENGCQDIDSVIVSQPTQLWANFSLVNVACFQDTSGSIVLNSIGGSGTITQIWNTGSNSDTLYNLSAGTYIVTITDSNSCTATASATITQPASAITTATNAFAVNCFGEANGSAAISATGGTGPITYQWSTGSALDSIYGLSAGQYFVVATDSNGCVATDTVLITEPDELITSIFSSVLNCEYDSNASLFSTTIGGTTPYFYSWSNGSSDSTISNLGEGTFSIIVTDAHDCLDSAEFELVALSHLQVDFDSVADVLCYDDTSGFASVYAQNGAGAYSYLWNNGAVISSTYLNSGTHTVTVTDSVGCQSVVSTTISEPDSLSIVSLVTDEKCENQNNGSIKVNVFGGSPMFSFLWNDSLAQQTSVADSLSPGSYSVTVTDANGCTLVYTDSIAPGNPYPVPDLGSDTIVTSGASLILNPGSFDNYQWFDGSTDSVFAATSTDTFWVMVSDSIGCSATDTVFITIWPLGFKQTVAGQITLYPNPTVAEITILNTVNFNGNVESVIMNALGETVLYFNTPVLDKSFKLDLSALAKGSYFLTIKAGDQASVFNIILM